MAPRNNYLLFTPAYTKATAGRIYCLLFTVHCSLSAYTKATAGKIHYSLFAIRYSLLAPPTLKLRRAGFTIYCLLFTVYCSLFTKKNPPGENSPGRYIETGTNTNYRNIIAGSPLCAIRTDRRRRGGGCRDPVRARRRRSAGGAHPADGNRCRAVLRDDRSGP